MGPPLFIYLSGVLPLRFLALMEPWTLLAVPDVGVCMFPKQRNEHPRQHKTRQTRRPPRTTRSALFYTVVCGMLPSHKTHCCFSDLSLTFWIFKMFTHKQAPRVCRLQLAPLSSLQTGKEHPASFARAGPIRNIFCEHVVLYISPFFIYKFEFLSKPSLHVGLAGIQCLPFHTVSTGL